MKMQPDTPEMARFNDALRSVMTVTKTELTALLNDPKAIAETRQKRGPKAKTSASGHASAPND